MTTVFPKERKVVAEGSTFLVNHIVGIIDKETNALVYYSLYEDKPDKQDIDHVLPEALELKKLGKEERFYKVMVYSVKAEIVKILDFLTRDENE